MSTLNNLFQQAGDQGELEQQTVDLLIGDDLGADINAALGVAVDDTEVTEALLVATLLDNSVSLEGREPDVRNGCNHMHETLAKSKQADQIFSHIRLLDGSVLDPFKKLKDASVVDSTNYQATLGHTPLYEQSFQLLKTVIAKSLEFTGSGTPARTITVIVTDGANNGRGKSASDVRTLVQDMLRQESHIVAGMGIDDGYTDFRKVFGDMGIPDRWILTPGNTGSEIRDAFRLLSQSVVQASQNAQSFSRTAGGGFGA
jgi:hypothetical protein